MGHHAGGVRLERHRHREGYVAVVLGGGYLEAGEGGRLRVTAGQVVVHRPWSAHRDEFAAGGASVLNLPLPPGLEERTGEVADVDEIARLAERDAGAAAALTRDRLRPVRTCVGDWPDVLATQLAADPDLQLTAWAHGHGIAASSLSRGFVAAFGVSPKRFRLEQRTRRALLALPAWRGTLAALAADAGFADQAHLARAVRSLAGRAPSGFR